MKMKKEFWLALLAFILLFCSCNARFDGNGEITAFPKATEESEETEVESGRMDADSVAPDTGYLSIDTVETEGYVSNCFAVVGNRLGLLLRLPEAWRLEKQPTKAFNIYTDGRHIGRIAWGFDEKDDGWRELCVESMASGDLDIKISIEKSVSSGEYRHFICFAFAENGEMQRITLAVDYRELGEAAISEMKTYAECKAVGSDPQLGIIDIENSNSDRILILGNSFIGSSRVGSILQEMMDQNRKNTVVSHVSRGYAHVDTYVYDDLIMDDIRSGMYGAVFICGFYSKDQVQSLAVLKNACDDSGTALFMFPAHNEPSDSIAHARKRVRGVYLLNWKEEVQAFIDNGGNKWDFCIDDQHLHSTPLAGYIGAHMIYRAIHGEIPIKPVNQIVLQSEVDRILGDYPKTGIIYNVGVFNLYFFD
jgi:hypothetical protein